jgi:hypothetical protein
MEGYRFRERTAWESPRVTSTNRWYQAFGAEGFGPFVERQVAGDHRGPALIALRDQLEQQFGAGLGQRYEAQLVDDQQFDGNHLLLDAKEPAFVARLHQLVDQRGGGGEADGHALLAGCQPQAQGHVCFASSAGAEVDHVLASFDPFATHQLQHLHLVQLRDRLEVKAVQALGGRELRGLDASLDHPPLAVDQFQFDQARQELDMVQPFGGALARNLLVFPQERGQLQRLRMVGKQDLRGLGHAASPDSRDM